MSGKVKNIFVTGLPGCGKTTLIMRVLEGLPTSVSRAGFLTEELREGSRRVGFKVGTLEGRQAVLAHVRFKTGYSVGKYGVDLTAFENLVLPALVPGTARLTVIDEVGRMECLSKAFCRQVETLLSSSAVVLGSVALKGGGFIGEVRARKDVEVVLVTPGNREGLVATVVERIMEVA